LGTGTVSSTGKIYASTVYVSGAVSSTTAYANLFSGNVFNAAVGLQASGPITATGRIYATGLYSSVTTTFTGKVWATGLNLVASTGTLSAAGRVWAAGLAVTGTTSVAKLMVSGALSGTTIKADIVRAQYIHATGVLTATGNVVLGGDVWFTGTSKNLYASTYVANVLGLIAGGAISAARLVTSGTITTAGKVHSTGTYIRAEKLYSVGAISGAGLFSSGTISVVSARVFAAGIVSSGTVTSAGNVFAAGNVITPRLTSTGNIQIEPTATNPTTTIVGNLVVTGNIIVATQRLITTHMLATGTITAARFGGDTFTANFFTGNNGYLANKLDISTTTLKAGQLNVYYSGGSGPGSCGTGGANKLQCSSDRRLKTNIKYLGDATEGLRQLRGVSASDTCHAP
jgi:hypothetical protein